MGYGYLGYRRNKGSRRERRFPTKPRSIPDVMDTKFAAPNRTAH